MTPEQLLIQRYKVIAPYPGIKAHGWKVGDILDRNWCEYQNGDEDAGVIEWQISDYPTNFQPLPWWSDRKVEDMPAFIKCDERVWKVTEWRRDIVGRFFPMDEVDVEGESENFANIKWHFASAKFLPAMIAEYNEWKQSNK
jgi:hypothetical protein